MASGLGARTQVSLPAAASFYFEKLIHPRFPRFVGKPRLPAILPCCAIFGFPRSPQPASPLALLNWGLHHPRPDGPSSSCQPTWGVKETGTRQDLRRHFHPAGNPPQSVTRSPAKLIPPGPLPSPHPPSAGQLLPTLALGFGFNVPSSRKPSTKLPQPHEPDSITVIFIGPSTMLSPLYK